MATFDPNTPRDTHTYTRKNQYVIDRGENQIIRDAALPDTEENRKIIEQWRKENTELKEWEKAILRDNPALLGKIKGQPTNQVGPKGQ